MAFSTVYHVKINRSGSLEHVTSIVLQDDFKAIFIMAEVRPDEWAFVDRLNGCGHKCKHADKPARDEQLDLSGLAHFLKFKFGAPAKYVPPSLAAAAPGKFRFTAFARKGKEGFRSSGDWEAEDSGVPPLT
jgi:hypothetical protein